MKKKSYPPENVLPPQTKGKESTTTKTIEAADIETARQLFASAKKRLLDINKWDDYTSLKLTNTSLTDSNGKVIQRKPAVGDFIRADLIGPGTVAGKGFDWVRIEAMDECKPGEEAEDFFALRVRPCSHPVAANPETSHFFTSDATNTFILERKGTSVNGYVIGRNEMPNTANSKLADKIRNGAVAAASAMGFSEIQWKDFLNGVLDERSIP